MTKTKFNSQKLEIYTTETKEQPATETLPNMWNLNQMHRLGKCSLLFTKHHHVARVIVR